MQLVVQACDAIGTSVFDVKAALHVATHHTRCIAVDPRHPVSTTASCSSHNSDNSSR